MAINREKEAAVLRWLSCYDIKVRSISDLQDGLQLLKLLSTINQTCSIENVEPGKAFPNIEKQLCEYHSCLPAHFLSSGTTRKQRYSDIQLATTSVLALSALALRTTSCSPTSNVAPLLKLDEATQCCIRDLIEIVSAGDDVIDNLVAYLKASAVEEESFLCVSKVKRRKSESFTASPTEAKTPAKRSSMSPQQRASLPAHQLKEMHMLREHITDEEQANIELRRERSKLTEVLKRKDREISKLKERIQALQSLSFSDATSITKLNKNVEETLAQNKLLQEQVHSLEKVREEYDKVIRQNVSLQAECEKITKLQEECNNLKEHLSAALSEKSDLHARLASVEESAGELRHELDAKTQELDSLVSFYSDKEKPILNSPKAQLSPPGGRVSCYMELRMVDLEETNKKLREESCRLQNEIEGVTAKLQAENNAIRASVVQLEEAKEALTAETLQLKNRCTKLTTRISGLENELQLSKTTNAKLESQLSIQVSQSETFRQQLADKDQRIATLEEKSAASDSMNQELLKSNGELNAALRSSEVEKVAQAERMREVIAENRKYQDALSQQKSKVLTLTTTLESLEVKLAEVVGRSESLSSQLSASEEQRAKLEQQIATLCSELEEYQSRCRDLEHQLSLAGCEKEAQATRLLDVQGELCSVKCTADRLQVQVQELEASKQQLDTLCFELQKKLSERECQLSVAAERNEALLKIKEEVLAADASLRAQFAEESEQHSMLRNSLQNRLQESEALAARLQEEKQGLAEKSTKLEAEAELLHSELSKLQEKNTALCNELSEFARSREELNNNLRSQNEQLEKVASECSRLQQCVEESEAERALLEARREKEAEVICALEKKCEEQAALSENLHSDNVALKSSQEEANIKIQHLEASITDANNKNLSLQNDLRDARQKLEDLLAERKTLETELSEKSSSCSTLQAELSEVKEKLRASENQEHILRNANAGLDLFVSECQQKLQQSESRLQDATRQIGPLREQVAFFQQLARRLNLEKEFLHSSLATAEVALQSLEVKFQASTSEVDEMRSKFKESQHRQTQLSSLVAQLQEECKSLKMVLADMSEKLSCCEKELSSVAIEKDNMASQLKEFECENARLKHENQALEDYVGNLEVKLNNQLELKRKGEEDYYECVKERDAHKEALRQQIDELTVKVAEKEELQDQLQELQRQFEEYKTSSAGNNGNLSKENERLELELASVQRELQSAISKHDELSRKVKTLQEENEGLKHEAKCKNEDSSKNMQATLASFSAVMDSAKQEVHIWKEKCRKQQAYREQREKLLKQRIAEMTETIKKTSQDTEALKAQTERQTEQLTAATEERDKLASELAAMKKERDKLATERRSLEAQLSYCDTKLREYSKEAKKAPGKAVNQSLYSTPSLESVWSQRQPSRRQSNASIASTDEFKVPHFKGNLRRESSSRSGKLTQAAAALDSSIFSESRFSCDEEQGFFSETAVADLGSLPDDPMGRYSELYRRNSMLPQHLRSVYPVETQQCPIPATPLRGGDAMFPFSEAPSPAAAAATPAAPSRQPQPSSTTDDTSKRKRDARSSSSSDSNGKSSFWI